MSARAPDDGAGTLPQVLIIIVIVAVIGFVGASALSSTADVTDGLGAEGTEVFKNITDDQAGIGGDKPYEQVEVIDSRGNAVAFGYDGGNVTANWSEAENGGALTLSAWVRLDPNASVANSYHILNVGNGTAALQFDNGSWRAVYDNGTNRSAVTTTASAPKQFTQLALRSNGTHIELAVNGTVQNETVLGNNASTVNAEGLYGTIDEVREFDGAVSDTTLSELYSDDIRGQPNEPRTARLLLDRGSGSTARVVFAPGEADLQGDAAFTQDGRPKTLIKQSGNYTLSDSGLISVLGGSYLDRNPVLFVTFDEIKGGRAIAAGYSGVAELLGVVFIVLMLGVVTRRLQEY